MSFDTKWSMLYLPLSAASMHETMPSRWGTFTVPTALDFQQLLAWKITGIKRFLCKDHASRIGEKNTQTRWLISTIPTFNTVHSYNPTSFWAFCYCDVLSAAQVNVIKARTNKAIVAQILETKNGPTNWFLIKGKCTNVTMVIVL